MQTVSFHDYIPSELNLMIFSYLEHQDLPNVTSVCKRWNNLYMSSRIKYSIPLKTQNAKVFFSKLKKHVLGIRKLDLSELYLEKEVCLTDDDLLDIDLGFQRLQYLNLRNTRITDVGLSHVSKLPRLQQLELRECSRITDHGLVCLENIPHLRYLGLQKCSKISDSGLAHLVRLKELQVLDLTVCHKITDRGLVHLGRMSQLQSLRLSYIHRITNSGMSHLAQLHDLRYLNLAFTRISDAGLQQLGQGLMGCQLRSLLLSSTPMTDLGMQYITRLQGLTELDVSNCKALSDRGLECLSRLCHGLEKLNLSSCTSLTDEGLRLGLQSMVNLRQLQLRDCYQLTDRGVYYLKNLTKLELLSLEMCGDLTDESVTSISRLTRLETLQLGGLFLLTGPALDTLSCLTRAKTLELPACSQLRGFRDCTNLQRLSLGRCYPVTNDEMVYLGSLCQLRQLELQSGSIVGDQGLEPLAQLIQLHRLVLEDFSEITDQGLRHLGDLTRLVQLHLNGCSKVTGTGVEYLTKLSPTLTDLHMSYSGANDAGLYQIGRVLTQLKVLHLYECHQITDAGLGHLCSLSRLKGLDIQNCASLTPEGVQSCKFQPGCQVLRSVFEDDL